MAQKRDSEDVFKPLNDAPSGEVDEPRRSGRGWEIKLGLLILLLVVGGTGYVAYTQLIPRDDSDELAADSIASDLDAAGDTPLADQVVPAYVPPLGETEPEGESRSVVMTQWSGQPDLETAAQADAWTPSEPVEDQAQQTFEPAPSEVYAESGSADSLTPETPSAETTFAPMPNPGDFTAGTAASAAPQTATLAEPSPGHDSDYADRVAAKVAEATLPDYAALQTDTAPLSATDQSTAEATGAPPATTARQWGAAPTPGYAPAAVARPGETSLAPAFTPPAAASASAYDTAQQNAYVPAVSASPLPRDSYGPYAAAPSKTPAEYVGLSGGAEEPAPAEVWQQPSVVPVDGRYTAQPNDNFYTISKKVYGSGAYFEALARYNDDKYPKPNQIRIGDVVQAPPVETLESRFPELCPKPEHRDAARQRSAAVAKRSVAGRRVYVVQEGDNLFDIARFELGARAKVAELIELNRDVLGEHINYLTPGMRLVLPETDERGPKVTQGPTNTLR